MKIDTLVTSISEMSERDALVLILERRKARRERPMKTLREVKADKKAKTPKVRAAKKERVKADPTAEHKALLLKLLQEQLELQAARVKNGKG